MLVIVPFCHRDAPLAVKVLRWAASLDGHVPFKCLLVHDKEAPVDGVRIAAEAYFSGVTEFVASVWPGQSKLWPRPQNFQFQETAGYLVAQGMKGGEREPWLWWEPDATPLKAGWLQAIADEHAKGGKPYSGHIVAEPYGHMTGVGVYPWNAASLSLNAMTASNEPWDVISKRDMIHLVHPVNHLIQHVWELGGVPCTFSSRDDVDAVVSKTAVLFHRCKDGSLIDVLNGPTLMESVKAATNGILSKLSITVSDDIRGAVTAVITTHNRPDGLLRAHKSCLDAGFTNIVVGASGISADVERALQAVEKHKKTKALRFGNEKSGEIWARAVGAVQTELCCILHDDDRYVSNLMRALSKPIEEGHKLIVWPGQIDNPALGGSLNEIGASLGKNSSRLISNHLSHKSRSITPCRGCYPTKIAEDALWEAHRQFDGRFYYRDGFLVGNDMLLWLRLTNEIPSFYGLTDPGVILGTATSTTVQDIKSGSTKLMDIYDATREYWDTCPKKRHRGKLVVTGYIPDDTYPGVHRWSENMLKYPPTYEQIYIADHSGRVAKECKAQRVQPHPDKEPKLCGSSIRFVDMVRAAYFAGADYMIVNEPDVRVNAAGWDVALADEFFDWPYDAVAGGCPVLWNVFSGHAERVDAFMRYGHEYREKSGVLPAYEIAKDVGYPILYPNGALGVWDVTEFKLLFPDMFANPNACYKTLYPYDDKIGRMWWGVYEHRVTRKVAWLASAYSGCGDRWYNEKQRVDMLTSGRKIAVHQIKSNEL